MIKNCTEIISKQTFLIPKHDHLFAVSSVTQVLEMFISESAGRLLSGLLFRRDAENNLIGCNTIFVEFRFIDCKEFDLIPFICKKIL